jgi:hypothetical protein
MHPALTYVLQIFKFFEKICYTKTAMHHNTVASLVMQSRGDTHYDKKHNIICEHFLGLTKALLSKNAL